MCKPRHTVLKARLGGISLRKCGEPVLHSRPLEKVSEDFPVPLTPDWVFRRLPHDIHCLYGLSSVRVSLAAGTLDNGPRDVVYVPEA
jgi:hypothetical protein